MATTEAADSRTCSRLIVCHRVRPVTSAPLMARMAPPRGAITMAPMIDAVESWNRPNVATNDASVSRTM